MKKLIAVLCCLCFLFSFLSLPVSAAEDDLPALVNNAPLHPMKTNYEPLDQKIELILDYITEESTTTFDKLLDIYYFCATYFSFNANAVIDMRVTRPLYVSEYDAYSVAEANSILNYRGGVCNHFSAMFMILVRAIGLECYQIGGKKRASDGTWFGHQLNVIRLNGEWFVFDTQAENNVYRADGELKVTHFFGFTKELAEKEKYFDFSSMDEYINGFGSFRTVGSNKVGSNIPGDVDGDGELTSGDARLALRASVQLEKYEKGSAQFLAADVDGSGVIESSDARLILRASVKLEDPAKWGK